MHIAMHAGAVQNSTPHGAPNTPQPRLVKAAHEFEAQLMKELMKPLMNGKAPGEVDDGSEDSNAGMSLDSGAGSEGALGEFATEALARALSEHGGFGIADKIIAQLSNRGGEDAARIGNESESEREIGKENLRPKIKTLR